MSNHNHPFKGVNRNKFFEFIKDFPIRFKLNQFKHRTEEYITYEIHSGYGHPLDGEIVAQEITSLMGETQYYLSTLIYK